MTLPYGDEKGGKKWYKRWEYWLLYLFVGGFIYFLIYVIFINHGGTPGGY